MLKQIKLPIRSYKPGSSIYIVSKDFDCKECHKEEIALLIKDVYNVSMDVYQKEINHTFEEIYGKPLVIKKRLTSEVIIKLKNIMQQTGKTIVEITQDIRGYLGYPCSFFRLDGIRTIPIDSQRITKAYELMRQRASILKVEDALYF